MMFISRAIGASLLAVCLSFFFAVVLSAPSHPAIPLPFYHVWIVIFILFETAMIGFWLLVREGSLHPPGEQGE
jgi:hypothetical protein